MINVSKDGAKMVSFSNVYEARAYINGYATALEGYVSNNAGESYFIHLPDGVIIHMELTGMKPLE